MKEGIREETVGFLFNLEVQVEEDEEELVGAEPDLALLENVDTSGASALGNGVPVPAEHVHEHSPLIRAKGLQSPRAPQHLTYSAPGEQGEVEVVGDSASNADDPYSGVSRNALCPCGSGKKYKKCHGAPGGPTGMTTRAGG
jgi:preprotein translocase subunit SecA